MTLNPTVVLRRARVWGAQGPQEPNTIILDGRGIESIGLEPDPRVEAIEIDLDGRILMPGLVDRHCHFTLWSKHRARLDVSGMASAADAAARVGEASAGATGLLVGRGFQDALWPDEPTAELLDQATRAAGSAELAVVLLSHDLHSVWINSAAARRFGVKAGLLREAAAFDLEIALENEEGANQSRVESLVADAARAAASRGITGIMDLEMADNPAIWARRVQGGLTSLRVLAGVYPQHLAASIERGERTGKRLPETGGLVTVGPLKVFADGALNTRTAWCFDPYPSGDYGHSVHARGDLATILSDAKDAGFEVALHAIGDRAVSEALDAFEASGARGSIEHAQLVRERDVKRFASLGIIAGIHPEHALDDRHVTDVMWKGRTGRAFPYRALAAAGVRLALGSDAPVSPLDPWLGISAAVHRTRDDLPAWEPGNGLDLETALRSSWATPGIALGQVADVIALDADPAALDAKALREMPVALTMTAGVITHNGL